MRREIGYKKVCRRAYCIVIYKIDEDSVSYLGSANIHNARLFSTAKDAQRNKKLLEYKRGEVISMVCKVYAVICMKHYSDNSVVVVGRDSVRLTKPNIYVVMTSI